MSTVEKFNPFYSFSLLLFITGMILTCVNIQQPAGENEGETALISENIRISPSPMRGASGIPAPSPTPMGNNNPTHMKPDPTNTPPVFPSKYDLPAWMADPAAQILASGLSDDREDTKSILFTNASRGNKFELPLPTEACCFFWYDNSHFGLLAQGGSTMHLISTGDGTAYVVPIPSQAVQYIDTSDTEWIQSLKIYKTEGTSNGFFFEDEYSHSAYSKQNTYKVKESYSVENEYQFMVTKIETDRIIFKSPPQDGFWDAEWAWSPVDDSILSIVSGKLDPGGFITKEIRMQLIDVEKGSVVESYSGAFRDVRFSPDGKRIVYIEPFAGTHRDAFQGAPCILSLDTRSTRCLTNIPTSRIPDGYSLLTTGIYEWIPDGNSISFIYIHGTITDDWKMLGNLCLYNLSTGTISCPTDGVDDLTGRSIIWYKFSPDEKFVYYCFAVNSILTDYTDDSWDAIIGVDGIGYTTWTGHVTEDGNPSCSSTIWRPPPE